MADANAPGSGPLQGTIKIVPYSGEYRVSMLETFRSNVPESFSPEEEAGFLKHVDGGEGAYMLWVQDGRVLACGGYAFEGSCGVLCWGIVHREQQGRGLGRALLALRIKLIYGHPEAESIRLETAPETESFFARYGFAVTLREPDGYGPGKTRVVMTARLDDAFRRHQAQLMREAGLDRPLIDPLSLTL